MLWNLYAFADGVADPIEAMKTSLINTFETLPILFGCLGEYISGLKNALVLAVHSIFKPEVTTRTTGRDVL